MAMQWMREPMKHNPATDCFAAKSLMCSVGLCAPRFVSGGVLCVSCGASHLSVM